MTHTSHYSAKITDISKWQINKYLQTGGTRAKCWVVNPINGKLCFFKESHHNYSSEFWMEIIASKIGQLLKLNMLDYNIALQGNRLGCISNNMIDENHDLSELIKFLTGYDKTYDPDPKNKENQARYTITFIEEALKHYGLGEHIDSIIQVIVFDSLIGNQDRHQENWGFISPRFISGQPNLKPISFKIIRNKWIYKVSLFFYSLKNKINIRKKNNTIDQVFNWSQAKFSPIYDSGSCLGRENTEEKIERLLNNPAEINAYIKRGKSEVRIDGNKIDYFQLITQLLNTKEYSSVTKKHLKNLISNFKIEEISHIINKIDDNIPQQYQEYKLSSNRKKFIIKLLSLRLGKLQELLNGIQ